MKLGKISKINTGLVLNRKKSESEETAEKKYSLLTLKSIQNVGKIEKEHLDEFYSTEVLSENYITSKGDVVIRISEPNTAVFINAGLDGILVPSQFCLIRVNEKKINPEFLAWYLNSEYVKKEIQKSLIGSTIGIIKTSFLNELEVKIISIEKQEKIIKINELKNKEEELTKKLIEEKQKMYSYLTKKIFEKREK